MKPNRQHLALLVFLFGGFCGLVAAEVEKTRQKRVQPTKILPCNVRAYDEDWGRMGREGHGLSCEFPQKWMSADGLTMWSIFSVYREGAKQGIDAHDKFNLVKATLILKPGK